jgi:hypothetical protein
MKKLLIYIIIAIFAIPVIIGIIGVIVEPESSKQLHGLQNIESAINKADKIADLEAALVQLAELRGKLTDSALISRADSITNTADTHRKRIALDEKKAAAAYAYSLAKELVLKTLKAPKTASFSGYNDSKYWYDEKHDVYYVQLYVDAQNSFGAMIRQHYQLQLKQTNGSWRLKDVIQIDGY